METNTDTTQEQALRQQPIVRPPFMKDGKRNPEYWKWYNSTHADRQKEASRQYRRTDKGKAAHERRKAKLRSQTRKKKRFSPALARRIRTMKGEGWSVDQIVIAMMVPQSVVLAALDSDGGPNAKDHATDGARENKPTQKTK